LESRILFPDGNGVVKFQAFLAQVVAPVILVKPSDTLLHVFMKICPDRIKNSHIFKHLEGSDIAVMCLFRDTDKISMRSPSTNAGDNHWKFLCICRFTEFFIDSRIEE